MTLHTFRTWHEPPWGRLKEHSEDEVETAECTNCGLTFQEPLNDDAHDYGYGLVVTVHEALSWGWLRDRSIATTCEDHIVDEVHDL